MSRWTVSEKGGFYKIIDSRTGKALPVKFMSRQAEVVFSLLNQYEDKLEALR